MEGWMRGTSWLRLLLVSVALAPMSEVCGQTSKEDNETLFETSIRPILAGRCFSCHGGKKVSNGLRVDSREALIKGGESGPSVLPGDADGSLLVQAIRYSHEDIRMPPDRRLPATVA